jgi:hypothetical protein
MKTFLLILFFGKSVLLTPDYVDIDKDFTIELNESISAITSGASIKIDVVENLKYEEGVDISNFRQRVRELYPPNSIEASLIEKNGEITKLVYGGSGIMFNNKNTLLSLESYGGVPTDREFVKVIIHSKVTLDSVLVNWVNYKK